MSLNAYAIVSAGVRCLHFRQDPRAMRMDWSYKKYFRARVEYLSLETREMDRGWDEYNLVNNVSERGV